MDEFEKQGGVAFLVLFFSMRNELFLSALSGYDALLEPGEGGRKKELPLCGAGSALLSGAKKRSAGPIFRRTCSGILNRLGIDNCCFFSYNLVNYFA